MAERCKVCGATATVHLEAQPGVPESYCQPHGEIQARARAGGLEYLGILEPADAGASGSAASRRQAGIERLQRGDLRGAIVDLTEALRVEPEDAVALQWRGVARGAIGDLAGINDCWKATQLDPRFAAPFLGPGTGSPAEVKIHASGSAVSFAVPSSFGAAISHFWQGEACLTGGDLDGAITHLRKAVETNSQFARAHARLGATHFRKGEWDTAISHYTRAIEVDPQHPAHHFNRGLARQRKEDHEGAIADYTEVLARDPNDDMACFYRGMVHAKTGDLSAAIADFTKVIEIAPGNSRAYLNRSILRGMDGDVAGADHDYARALELDPSDTPSRETLSNPAPGCESPE